MGPGDRERTEARHEAVTTHDSPPASFRREAGERPLALVVVQSPDEAAIGRAVALTEGLTVVGRDVGGAGLGIRDSQLSRVHFRVVVDPRTGERRMGDAGSRNGTFVNGNRVDGTPLRAADVVRAGESVFVLGEPEPLREVEERAARLAPSEIGVLVVGETGTGKERLARAVHQHSGRSGPFVAVNCGTFVRDLLAAELFGHVRGAFSGATAPREGLFRAAEGGTLFLDEIGDMPLDLQAMLLRTLQERTVRPLGTDEETRIDVRVVAATNVQLEDAVREGRFRADLHARLAGAVLEVPPLRARRTTVLSLARAFAARSGLGELRVTANAAEALVRHAWPYNVRELESFVHALAAERWRGVIDMALLQSRNPAFVAGFRSPEEGATTGSPAPATDQRAALLALLEKHDGNVSSCATELGKPRSHLYRWFKTLGIDPGRFRERSS